MVNFCKNVSCPSSQELLAFQNGENNPKEDSAILSHLIKCDFCAAEVEFYQNFPQSDDQIEIEEIPQPLFELAEALLCNRRTDLSRLNKLLNESEGLTLEKALTE